METKVVLRVLVNKSQKVWIKAKSKQQKTSEAEIVRQVLDKAIQNKNV